MASSGYGLSFRRKHLINGPKIVIDSIFSKYSNSATPTKLGINVEVRKLLDELSSYNRSLVNELVSVA